VQINKDYAKYSPRPIPKCLDDLRCSTEAATGCKFNLCLVNYYASGSDSISYHSDDERFLGELPAIASFSLGARRDFLMKHKPIAPNEKAPPPPETKPIKLPLASGDMILMRGTTQANVTNLFLCPIPHVPYFTGRENEHGPGCLPVPFPPKKQVANLFKWLHSIPKRTGKNADNGGRINITFRRAMVKGGTENYYNYNVGTGPVYKWDNSLREMRLWKA